MSVRTLKDLQGLKEEHIAVLAEMGIESVADMKDALSDEAKVKELVKTLSGVGPKTVGKWKEELENVDIAKQSAAKEAVKKETRPAEIIEERPDPDAYYAKAKPELDDETKDALAKRALISGRRPEFRRQEWFRYSKLGEKWRRPKGIHSKMRRKMKHRPPAVAIGYRGPAAARDLHPSGFEEKLVFNAADLEGIDPKKQAVRIGGTVGTRKRIIIEDRADELGIRVLNRMV
ncbi:MAG: 50S ribosomal protein L32e [Methanomassiliicoccaceae archaeon]|nr:50S ribosomal protein L32e [Methanomassiliicoccaceae archaeon]